VFLLVGSQDIGRVRDEARENLECLIEKVSSFMSHEYHQDGFSHGSTLKRDH
jgi:hypothetical protein